NELQVLFGQAAEAAMIVKTGEVVEQRQSAQTGLHAMALHGVAQSAGKRLVIDVGFADIILSPGSESLGGKLFVVVPGQEHERNLGSQSTQLMNGFEVTSIGQTGIEEDEV